MKAIRNINGRRIILPLILVLVAFEFIRDRVGMYTVVEGDSMYPTFSSKSVVRARPAYQTPQRGDVVIISDDRGRAIKRVIGLPGETLTLYHGFVYINGRRLKESYLPDHTYTFKASLDNMNRADWVLGDGEFFVMGDNRLESCDSRNFGPIKTGAIHGVVSMPDNSAKPAFSDIILSRDGKVFRIKQASGRSDRNS